jgi:hypothetical protein
LVQQADSTGSGDSGATARQDDRDSGLDQAPASASVPVPPQPRQM